VINTEYRYIEIAVYFANRETELRVDWFLNYRSLHFTKPRDVKAALQRGVFLESVFKRHHLPLVIAIVIAFIFLVLVRICSISDARLFRIPAAPASIILYSLY
jgi:transcription initiation factor IIF auxiliary subunit